MSNIEKAQQAADVQRNAAKVLMGKLHGLPEGEVNELIDTIVNCIIGAAVLETALLTQEAVRREHGAGLFTTSDN